MGFEELLIQLVVTAGPVAAGIVAVLAVIFFGLKWSGVGAVIGDKKQLVDDGKITAVQKGVDQIHSKLDTVENRLTTVERDLDSRVLRKELHELELAVTRFEGRFDMMEAQTRATGASVTRIEDFLLRLSERNSK